MKQGVFVHDAEKGSTRTVAKTGARFDKFTFWNYSGKTPCVGSGGHGQEEAEEDGEPARWRPPRSSRSAGSAPPSRP